ncbi:MAG: single-stranded DNA-binding protein, partial [Chitinophagales bacterium]|nr:single-stranded DNA-binding protein [Chitinophagales bacterium]
MKNSVRLIGNLGATPEFKSLESGAKMARVSLATSEFHYEPDPTATLGKKKVTVTQWH